MAYLKLIFICYFVKITCLVKAETTLHCSAKPGCQLSKCDPAPEHWNKFGFSLEEHFQRNEFPITCKQESGNVVDGERLQLQIYNNYEDISRMQAEINKQNKDIATLKTRIESKEKDNQRLSKVVSDLSARLKTVEQNFDQLPTNTQKTTTANAGGRSEKDLGEECIKGIGGICFWTEIHDITDITYKQAVAICKTKDSRPAIIKDKKTYDAIAKHIRTFIPRHSNSLILWTGIIYNPKTGLILPQDSYTPWRPSYPFTGGTNMRRTQVYMDVHRSSINRSQGVKNGDPNWAKDGVLCQVPF